MKVNTQNNSSTKKNENEHKVTDDMQITNDFENSPRLRDHAEFIKMFGSWEYPDPDWTNNNTNPSSIQHH